MRFAALGNQTPITKPETFRVQAAYRAKRFLRGGTSFLHEEVQFVVDRNAPSCARRRLVESVPLHKSSGQHVNNSKIGQEVYRKLSIPAAFNRRTLS